MLKIAVIVCLIAIGSATYVGPLTGYGGPLTGYGGPGVGVIIDKPIPYDFGYDVVDEYGTQLTRQESGDGSGSVKGSYSYKDDKGLTRLVEYVADGHGFRATVKTNEPGTETSAPADVLISANPVIIDQPILRPLLARNLKGY